MDCAGYAGACGVAAPRRGPSRTLAPSGAPAAAPAAPSPSAPSPDASGLGLGEGEDELDSNGARRMSRRMVHRVCVARGLYLTPTCNTTLYLQARGGGKDMGVDLKFRRIENLEEFTGCRVLHLSNNCLTSLEGLGHMRELQALYVQNNDIRSLEGLRALGGQGGGGGGGGQGGGQQDPPQAPGSPSSCPGAESPAPPPAPAPPTPAPAPGPCLHTLNVSGNPLGAAGPGALVGLPGSLRNLHAANIGLSSAAALDALAEACPNLEVLDVSGNAALPACPEAVRALCRLRGLRVLYPGNTPLQKLPNLRRLLVSGLPRLSYLDEQPVEEVDRRGAEAWRIGGVAAEKAARLAYWAERRLAARRSTLTFAAERERRRALREAERAGADPASLQRLVGGGSDWVEDTVARRMEPALAAAAAAVGAAAAWAPRAAAAGAGEGAWAWAPHHPHLQPPPLPPAALDRLPLAPYTAAAGAPAGALPAAADAVADAVGGADDAEAWRAEGAAGEAGEAGEGLGAGEGRGPRPAEAQHRHGEKRRAEAGAEAGADEGAEPGPAPQEELGGPATESGEGQAAPASPASPAPASPAPVSAPAAPSPASPPPTTPPPPPRPLLHPVCGAAECVVCAEAFAEGEAVAVLPCGHYFHDGCIRRWLLGFSGACPVCRQPVGAQGQKGHGQGMDEPRHAAEAPQGRVRDVGREPQPPGAPEPQRGDATERGRRSEEQGEAAAAAGLVPAVAGVAASEDQPPLPPPPPPASQEVPTAVPRGGPEAPPQPPAAAAPTAVSLAARAVEVEAEVGSDSLGSAHGAGGDCRGGGGEAGGRSGGGSEAGGEEGGAARPGIVARAAWAEPEPLSPDSTAASPTAAAAAASGGAPGPEGPPQAQTQGPGEAQTPGPAPSGARWAAPRWPDAASPGEPGGFSGTHRTGGPPPAAPSASAPLAGFMGRYSHRAPLPLPRGDPDAYEEGCWELAGLRTAATPYL
ncbi:hypothetical protein HYH03_014946 [Edaphochlamys debaryana]|uniref:RING-type domain-containing protein n=1 Tax=Edaphochlamys debaryana TaxID=47281 RepID=A0A835XT07_9CHLO|nr:hypothetical protein HYH03_014946 [Edaphochlamys debaryana]|eukprot:KAG2486365.1 hypothetical protein HYH03_014946 [Edaphochlamys debaryana]